MRAGFTVVEVLVAAALTGLVASVALGLLVAVLTAWGQLTERREQDRASDEVVGCLRDDLACALIPPDGAVGWVRSDRGSSGFSFSFYRQSDLWNGSQPGVGLVVWTFEPTRSGWKVSRRRWKANMPLDALESGASADAVGEESVSWEQTFAGCRVVHIDEGYGRDPRAPTAAVEGAVPRWLELDFGCLPLNQTSVGEETVDAEEMPAIVGEQLRWKTHLLAVGPRR